MNSLKYTLLLVELEKTLSLHSCPHGLQSFMKTSFHARNQELITSIKWLLKQQSNGLYEILSQTGCVSWAVQKSYPRFHTRFCFK